MSAVLRLSHPGRTVGAQHRSGWPYVRAQLDSCLGEGGILLDDFVEHSFMYRPVDTPYTEPWVGIFHHPQDAPAWTGRAPRHFFANPVWRASQESLRLVVALSRHLAGWLEAALGVPAVAIPHPTAPPPVTFSMDAFVRNPERMLVQVGWFLRNTSAIDALPPPRGLARARLAVELPWAREHAAAVRARYARHTHRPPTAPARRLGRLDAQAYDQLLCRNVVFVQFLAVSASNTVVECMARNTPILVNRLPAVVEYLGEDYPLLYDSLDEAPGLLTIERIAAAHAHLATLDKSALRGTSFRETLVAAVAEQRGRTVASASVDAAGTAWPRAAPDGRAGGGRGGG